MFSTNENSAAHIKNNCMFWCHLTGSFFTLFLQEEPWGVGCLEQLEYRLKTTSV